jgi:hypothetical protein
VLVLAFVTLRRLRVRLHDPVSRAYAAFCAKLARRGLARGLAEGPLTYAGRIIRARPDLDAAVREFVALYVALRYGDASAENVGRLKKLAREFEA